jgi:superfamily II DNA or RNA helicase
MASNRIEIVSNALKAKLVNPSKEVKAIVTDALSYYVDGYNNTDAYKNGRWDGRSTMFDWATDTFPVGFRGLVNARLYKVGYKVINITRPLPEPLGSVPSTLGGFSYTDRYDYQWEGVKALEKRGIMIARFATGAGKTFHAALATARINRPTLILTKRQPLMYQFWERLKDFGFEPGIVGDNRFLIRDKLTVAMAQTLSKRLESDDEVGQAVREYLKKVEFIIGEEVHEISDSTYYNIIKNCPAASYRLGLTATPFMQTNTEANMRLLGAFGSVGMEVSEATLIDRGINARPIFKFASYSQPKKLKFGSNYHKAIFEGITHCEERNKVIVEHAAKAAEHKLPTLILIQRQEHGRILKALCKDAGLRTEYIYGEDDSEQRRTCLRKLGNGKLDVLIGSRIVDVGVDVPAIGLVIMAGGGKAEVAYRQRIGRGLREKRSGPNVCFILDFYDCHNRYLYDHYLERLRVIKGTSGFSESLLKEDTDFPWELFSEVVEIRSSD